MNILSARKFITLTAFDTTTEQGRNDERYRLALLSMGANVLSRGVAMLVMVLTVSLTISYLGAERFGVWMTIASFAGMLSFLDLGVGNALANRVSQVVAATDTDALRRTISGGLGFLFLIGCLVGALLFALSNVLPWQKIIKVQDHAVNIEARDAIKIFAILFGFSLFSNGIQRVFAGLQQAFISHSVSLVGSLLSLLALWQATQLKADIGHLLMATLGIQLLSNLLLLIILIKRKLFTTNYLLNNVIIESKHLSHAGGLFFILQIGTMVGWGADSLIIAGTLGAGQVAVFNIVQRLYQFMTQPLGIINNPLWAAYADANVRNEKNFIRRTLVKSMTFTLAFSTVGGCLLLIFGSDLIQLWTKSKIDIPPTLILIFFIWSVCDALGNAFAMMMNGCNIIRPQVYALISFIILSLPYKIYSINAFGLNEMLIGFTVIYIVNILFWYGLIFKPLIKSKLAD